MFEPVKSKSKPTIMPSAFGLAEYKRHDFVADIDPNLVVDDLLDPAYWAHVAAEMSPLDKIEARWEDGSRIAHLRVVFAERTYAKVKLLGVEELGDVAADAPVESMLHEVKWKGPMKKYCVIRKSDNVIVSDEHKERAQAIAWMQEHERA